MHLYPVMYSRSRRGGGNRSSNLALTYLLILSQHSYAGRARADVQRSHAQCLQVLARGVDLSNGKQSHSIEGCLRPCLGEITQNKRDCCVQGLRLELELEVHCDTC